MILDLLKKIGKFAGDPAGRLGPWGGGTPPPKLQGMQKKIKKYLFKKNKKNSSDFSDEKNRKIDLNRENIMPGYRDKALCYWKENFFLNILIPKSHF